MQKRVQEPVCKNQCKKQCKRQRKKQCKEWCKSGAKSGARSNTRGSASRSALGIARSSAQDNARINASRRASRSFQKQFSLFKPSRADLDATRTYLPWQAGHAFLPSCCSPSTSALGLKCLHRRRTRSRLDRSHPRHPRISIARRARSAAMLQQNRKAAGELQVRRVPGGCEGEEGGQTHPRGGTNPPQGRDNLPRLARVGV